jgi:hypothetical protein
MISRIIYLGYYLKKMEWDKVKLFQNFLSVGFSKNIFNQWISILFNSFGFIISILEYDLLYVNNVSFELYLKIL